MVEARKNELSDSCQFCDPSIKDYPHFARNGVERLDTVPIIVKDNLIVRADILPVSDSPNFHFLMVPRTHDYSFKALPDLKDEVGEALREIEEKAGLPIVFFEHGATQEGKKNQSIYHQHAHLITVPPGLQLMSYMSDVLSGHGIVHQLVETPDFSPIANLQTHFNGHGYLYVQHGRVGLIAHDPDDNFPSQITQRSMSKLMSGTELNWKRLLGNDDRMGQLSVQRMVSTIQHCKRT